MSHIPADRRYAKSHEWARLLPDGRVEIGITDHAQQALGDLVFVEVPEPGRVLGAGEACAVEVTPVTDSSFDCRVVVRCGDRVLYGRDEARGGTGYNHCGPVPSLIVDRDVTDDDGDPRLRVDLASGEVVVEEALGLGVQRVELALLDEE